MAQISSKKLMIYVASILTTALETEPDPFPESMVYLAMGSDLEKWELVKGIMLKLEHITCDGHCIRLTDKGRDLANKLVKALTLKE